MRIALVLRSGQIGGAETFTASLADELRRHGHDANMVVVTHGLPLAERLDRDRVPWQQIGLSRGSRVIGSAPRVAKMLSGADVVVLPAIGYLAVGVRFGGIAVVLSNEWVESFGMVAIEAMAAGLPAVASAQAAAATASIRMPTASCDAAT